MKIVLRRRRGVNLLRLRSRRVKFKLVLLVGIIRINIRLFVVQLMSNFRFLIVVICRTIWF